MHLRTLLTITLLGLFTMTAHTDEGMWLVYDPPKELLKTRHNFTLTEEWSNKAILASVRFNSGGSGGFVSARGLVVTNHHIAADALQKLSTPERDLFALGFVASNLEDELKCPDLELNVLQSMQDVTEKVKAAVKPEMSPAEAAAARRAVMSEIEKDSQATTKLRSEVVTLYQGGVYHLYRYKKYTDVRLVFAPEEKIASFGGDVDNFEYPRHSLDVAFFRAYEDGKPAATPNFFPWNTKGPAEGDLVFVTGHPGTTNRLETLEKLKHRRDITLPYTLARLRALEAALIQFGERGPEEKRLAGTDLHRVANARKAFSGQLQGLLDPAIMRQKSESEGDFQQRVVRKLRKFEGFNEAFDTIKKVNQVYGTFEKEHLLLESGHAFTCEYFTIARHLVRLSAELPKKSNDRLREYRDSNLDSLKFQLLSPAPIAPSVERVKLQTSLTFLAEQLGGEHPLVNKILAGKNPAQRAEDLIAGTKLGSVEERKKLLEGGAKAIAESDDPMIRLARDIDEAARKLRIRYEVEFDEPERQAYSVLANFRFLVFNKSIAPDATFTLRLAFGLVKGYEVEGETLPFHTTLGGVFEKSSKLGGVDPFTLPKRWLEKKDKLDLTTPFNFVSTADTIGGNSGSPVLNREGELIGINFDRNRHGLVRNFVYTEVQARHVAVHCRAVLEALGKIYDADALLAELTGKP
jgi:hypothetical protein